MSKLTSALAKPASLLIVVLLTLGVKLADRDGVLNESRDGVLTGSRDLVELTDWLFFGGGLFRLLPYEYKKESCVRG